EDVAIEKQQRAERLILRGRGDAAVHRERAQETRHLGRPHLGWMTLAVEEDIATDPCDVCRFRASAVMAKPSGGPHAVEQARLGWLRWTCLMKRERVAAPAGAGDRRVGRREVHRSAISFVPHGK